MFLEEVYDVLGRISILNAQQDRVKKEIQKQKDTLNGYLAKHEEFLRKDLEETDLVIKLTIEKPDYQESVIITERVVLLRVDRSYPKHDFGESLNCRQNHGINPATSSNLWPVDYAPAEKRVIDALINKMLGLGYSYCGEVFSNINWNTYKFTV